MKEYINKEFLENFSEAVKKLSHDTFKNTDYQADVHSELSVINTERKVYEFEDYYNLAIDRKIKITIDIELSSDNNNILLNRM